MTFIKNQKITIIGGAGDSAVGYTSQRVNGEILAVYTTAESATHNYTLELFASGGNFDSDFRIATVAATGAHYQLPRKVVYEDSGVQDFTGENKFAPFVIDDYVTISGSIMGVGSTVSANILYR